MPAEGTDARGERRPGRFCDRGCVSGTSPARRREPRLAAGRARTLGLATRGTTAPNRLRRVDRWIVGTQAARLRAAASPLVVDLGYGSSPVTTVELYQRLSRLRPDVRVVGLEIDRDRVAAAAPAARPPGLVFARGGFELAGLRPVLVRAMNVLRQYEEAAVAPAWAAMLERIAPGGLLVEGTCDEIGRRACWFAVDRPPEAPSEVPGAPGGPVGTPRPRPRHQGRTLTLAAHLPSLARPSELAERLPKSLIAHNVPGEDVHTLLAAFDDAWRRGAPRAVFGPRQRWTAAVESLRADGWPVRGTRPRWRLGEVTFAWPPVRADADITVTAPGGRGGHDG
ncbi:hypothetical protein FsymDg_4080 [Candidatus Protofrankia datiscae]|uniref:Class I SAM-dependent methyltransferase n=1 Tax=Candidatus Protofrankia datiscae TaxID=2716812 RepID=F8AW29_9ACTN|nr:hypothetical protein FsymDg_4080 [Candidatus Protofrankia datiscae]